MTKSGNGAANGWGVNSEYGKLHDVLLCEPVNFKWLPTSSISKATLRSGVKFDRQLAMTAVIDELTLKLTRGKGMQAIRIRGRNDD